MWGSLLVAFVLVLLAVGWRRVRPVASVVAGLAAGAVLLGGLTGPSEPAAPSAVLERTAALPSPSPAVQEKARPSPSPETVRSAAAQSRRAAPSRALAPLLFAGGGGDGDSWRDTRDREYRLGMVNTPEVGECFGAAATATRKELVAAGFRARVYSTDGYGRSVAVVTTAAGLNVNVHLARYGYANDRYLAEFRHEDPALARQLDVAFAAAKREGRGLWSACAAAAAPRPQGIVAASGCHPDYRTCVSVKGDGSGSGSANDLDCPEIGKVVYLRTAGTDPYRLDANGDGVGCESYA
ncbi:MAG: hypothetical protein JWN77_2378 [Frankiales bacterium]|nr:hypothetical protein [Frankiales bacterium]